MKMTPRADHAQGANDPGSHRANWTAIIGLAAGVFIFVTTSLMPMGLLPDIAESFGKSEAYTGYLVTGYAWVAAALTLPMTMLLSRLERRRVLLAILAVFALGHLLAALAASFSILMLARIVTAMAHAVMWGLATPLALSLASPPQKATVLAVMATGVSLSTIAGVPLGTLAGHAFGWRFAFGGIGVITVLLMLTLAWATPETKGAAQSPLANLAGLLRQKSLRLIYPGVFLTICGHAAAFTYFNPLMRVTGGFTPRAIVYLLLIFGLSGVAGSFLLSRFTGRWLAAATLITLAGLAGDLALGPVLVSAGAAPAVLFCVLWGASMTAAGVLFQAALFKKAGPASDLAMSLYAVFFNAAIGLGAVVGGGIFDHFGVAGVSTGGAAIVGAALLSQLAALLLTRKEKV